MKMVNGVRILLPFASSFPFSHPAPVPRFLSLEHKRDLLRPLSATVVCTYEAMIHTVPTLLPYLYNLVLPCLILSFFILIPLVTLINNP